MEEVVLKNLKKLPSPCLACGDLTMEKSKAGGCQELGLHFSILSEEKKRGFLRFRVLAFIHFVHKNDHDALDARKRGRYLRYQLTQDQYFVR